MINGELAYKNIIKIDRISNKIATELTPPELINEKIYREIHSILYYINKEDDQFKNWESSVENGKLIKKIHQQNMMIYTQ